MLSQGCFEGDLAEIGNRFISSTEALPAEDATTVVLNALTPAEMQAPSRAKAVDPPARRTSFVLVAVMFGLLLLLLGAYLILRFLR